MLSQTVSELFFVLHKLFGNTGPYYERVHHPQFSRGAVGITKVDILFARVCIKDNQRRRQTGMLAVRGSGMQVIRQAGRQNLVTYILTSDRFSDGQGQIKRIHNSQVSQMHAVRLALWNGVKQLN